MKPSRLRLACSSLVLLSVVLGTAVAAGLPETVHVRVLDPVSGSVLADDTMALDERLAIESDGQAHYVGLRAGQFRGQDVLELSLSSDPEEWHSRGYTQWHLPSRLGIGESLILELVADGWAGAFCDRWHALAETESRAAELSLRIDDDTWLLSPPDWDGASPAVLIEMSNGGHAEAWTASVEQDQLILSAQDSAQSLEIAGLRADFPAFRQFASDGQVFQVTHVPAGYARVFCSVKLEEGSGYAARIADYFFGREAD